MESKLTQKDYYKFYFHDSWENNKDYYNLSIKKAYRDLNRTITGFASCQKHVEIFKGAVEILKEELTYLINSNINTQTDFDIWHKGTSDKLIKCFGKDQIFNYGQSQKWINMSLKYFSMLDMEEVKVKYQYFHVPIDNYILIGVKYKFDIAWSRINNYNKYLEFQNWFRNTHKGIPLDNEFNLWLENV